MTDSDALAAAREVAVMEERGRKLTKAAAVTATDNMAKMVKHFGSKEGKVEALKHHGLYIGVGNEFMSVVAPKADSMMDELTELTGSHNEAKVLTQLWLAKVFLELQKALQAEHE